MNLLIPFVVLDTIWVIAHVMKKVYAINKDQFGLEKANNLIKGLRPVLPKEITEQKIP